MSNTDATGYPLPSYAATIWLAGDVICLALPSGVAGKSHTVRIPVDKCSVETGEWGEPLARQRGWLILMDILKQRQQLRESADGPAKIGTRAAPVQYDLDKILVGMKATRYTAEGKKEATYEGLFDDE